MTHPPSIPIIRFQEGGRTIEAVETMTDLDNEKVKVRRNVNTCPLDRAHFKDGLIDHIQHQAGEAFHANWLRVQIGSLSCPDLDRVPGEASHGEGDGEARARQWLKGVEEAVGPRSYDLLVLICGEERSFEEARQELNSQPQVGRRDLPRDYIGPRFSEALHDLAQHLGLTQVRSYGMGDR